MTVSFQKPALFAAYKPAEQAHISERRFHLPKIFEQCERFGMSQATVSLIVDYTVGKVQQFNIENMTAFFLKKVPADFQRAFIQQFKEYSSCLEDEPLPKKPSMKEAVVLTDTRERRLSALLGCYNSYHNFQLKQKHPAHAQQIKDDDSEYYLTYGLIPNVQIIQVCEYDPNNKCHTFVFGKEAWFKEADKEHYLYQKLDMVLLFLKTKGYKVSEKPAVGQIVIYFDSKGPSHFGKVVRIESDGTVWVESKFGSRHVFRHRLDLAQWHYGREAIFLSIPTIKS
jgi:hypothetical protein